MKKLKNLWNENKKTFLLYGGIGLVTIILIIVITIILMNVLKRYDYPKIESMLAASAQKYIQKHSELRPVKDGEVVIKVDELVNAKEIKELAKLSKDSSCTGLVTVFNNADKLRFVPTLTCDSYVTPFLEQTILNQEKIVTENSGLYSLNDFYTYRGEFVNNYVSFTNYKWRILKFNDDLMYLILDDTLNNKTLYVFDDRFNESSNNYRGKNDFESSRIKLTLQDFYEDYFQNNHATLKYMDACVNPRSEMDTDKTGRIECFTTYQTPISLLSVNDFMNASVDPNCLLSTSKSCSNYNYLAKTKNKYWLLNGTNENSFDVYYASPTGYLDLDNANTKKDLRLIIAIPSNSIYKSGNGTNSSPFQFYEY